MKTQKLRILTAIVATLLALATHAYLTAQNFRLKSGLLEGKSICNISSQFNCDAVALSKYAEFAGISTAVWGLATNGVLLLFLLVLLTRISVDAGRVARFTFALSLLVLAASLVMGIISTTQLGTYCLFCIAAYALSAVQAFAAYGITRDENPKAPFTLDLLPTFREQRWILVLIVLVPAIAWLGNRMARDSFGRPIPPHLLEETVAFWRTGAAQDFNLSEGLSFSAGDPAQAKMIIVEFADFLCPHCKTAATPLHIFTESHQDVRLLFKPFPLDGNCNSGITHKGDGYRCKLAAAVLCSEQLNQKGWVAHDWIFARQSELAASRWDKDLAEIATAVGAPAEQLQACVNAPDTQALLLRLTEEGVKAKIQGTPSIFVNGKRLDFGQSIQVLQGVHDSL